MVLKPDPQHTGAPRDRIEARRLRDEIREEEALKTQRKIEAARQRDLNVLQSISKRQVPEARASDPTSDRGKSVTFEEEIAPKNLGDDFERALRENSPQTPVLQRSQSNIPLTEAMQHMVKTEPKRTGEKPELFRRPPPATAQPRKVVPPLGQQRTSHESSAIREEIAQVRKLTESNFSTIEDFRHNQTTKTSELDTKVERCLNKTEAMADKISDVWDEVKAGVTTSFDDFRQFVGCTFRLI